MNTGRQKMLSESHYLFYSGRKKVCPWYHADAHTQPSWGNAMATAPLALSLSCCLPSILLPSVIPAWYKQGNIKLWMLSQAKMLSCSKSVAHLKTKPHAFTTLLDKFLIQSVLWTTGLAQNALFAHMPFQTWHFVYWFWLLYRYLSAEEM